MKDIQTVRPSPVIVPCRICSKQEKNERDKAVIDYYIDNRVIAYGEVPDSVPENLPRDVREEIIRQRVEAFCLTLYEKDVERIRRKYDFSENN